MFTFDANLILQYAIRTRANAGHRFDEFYLYDLTKDQYIELDKLLTSEGFIVYGAPGNITTVSWKDSKQILHMRKCTWANMYMDNLLSYHALKESKHPMLSEEEREIHLKSYQEGMDFCVERYKHYYELYEKENTRTFNAYFKKA